MGKLNFHYLLLEARLPEIYAEAIAKELADVKRNDIMSDWLLELHWRRTMMALSTPTASNEYHEITFEESEQDVSEFDIARKAMEGLKD